MAFTRLPWFGSSAIHGQYCVAVCQSHVFLGVMPCRVFVKLDAGWPESEEEQVGNVKLEEEVTRRIRIDRQEERQTYLDR